MPGTPDHGIELRLLGPVEAVRDGASLALGGRRQRALLALLALQRGQMVSTHRLVEELWSGDEPDGAATSLRAYVSKLRAALGHEVPIDAVAAGYAIRLPSEAIDLERFEARIRDAEAATRTRNPRRARDLLRQALGLWRGRPFGDLATDGSLRVEADRLEELRLHAIELRIDADLALGAAADLVDELEALTATHPYREAFWRQLMLALYRAERQADSLAAYHRARRALDEQLGIEPGEALQELQAAILRQDVPAVERQPERHGLPASITTFVGRERELSELGGLLRQHRLVTLSGVGGVGKTRLGIEAARALADELAGGAWFVDLAPVTDPAAVAASVAAALGVREQAGDALDHLVARFREGSTLVVLDNCEHLRAGVASLVLRLLQGAPGLRILATSREVLGVTGETEYAVPPLSLPGHVDTPAALRDSEAVRLFLVRAREAHPGLPDDDATLAEIGRICADLDGLPLALELAAARARVLSPAEIGARLHDRFRFLVSWRRLATARHRTLREAMDWSYDLLDPAAQTLLSELSTFSGGFTLEAVEAVASCGSRVAVGAGGPAGGAGGSGSGSGSGGGGRIDDGADDALELVERLAEASLVVVDHAASPTRYRLLETVREYGEERLEASGRMAELRDRHRRYFGSVAEDARESLRSSAIGEDWLARIDADQDNFRAALAHSLGAGDFDLALRISESLWSYWWIRGRPAEARSWLERALAGATGSEPLLRSRGMVASAGLGWALGEIAAAEERATAAVQLLDGLGEHILAASARNTLGLLAQARGDPEAARAWYAASIEQLRTADIDPAARRHHVAVAVDNMGTVSLDLGDDDEALRRYEEARELNLEAGDDEGIAMTDLHIALVGVRAGRFEEVRERLADSLALYRRVEFLHYVAECLEVAAALASGLGAERTAARILGGANRVRQEVGNPPVPVLAALRDQVTVAARAGLGPDFDAALAEGTAMSVADTIDSTLRFLRAGAADSGD